ncbi:MAG: lipopolysaccharide biosynthesis protein [Armatimonadota bacterium]|jgi:teichuronic acid exporter
MEDYGTSEGIGGRARTAAGWQFLSKGINTGLQMVTSIVLARLLMPADFGIVALATMVTGLANVFRDLGLGQALVQRKEIGEEHTRSAFWGTLVMAGLLYGGVVLAAPYLGEYFDEPRMVPVLKIIALTFVFAPLAVVPRSLLQRELDFKTPFFAGLVSSVAYGVVGVVMALLGYSYWALVGASLAGALVNTVALCILTRYLPPLVPTFRGIADLFGFGTGATGVGLMNYIATRVDYFVIGRKLDSDDLGLYTRAYQVIVFPLTIVSGTLYPILFPAFAQMQDDMPRARNAYRRVLTIIAVLTWPLLAALLVTAPEFVPTVFGDQWDGTILPLQIMTVAGALKTITNPSGALAKAMGTRYVFSQLWRQAVYAALLGVGAWWGAEWGINGVAWAVVAVNLVVFGLGAHLVFLAARVGMGDYIVALRGPLLASLGTALPCLAARQIALAHNASALVTLVVSFAIAAVASYLLVRFNPFEEVRASYAEVATMVSRKARA